MRSCDEMQERISRMLDGDLSARERAELADHLDSCPECSAVYEAFAALRDGLRDAAEEPPAALTDRIMARVREETPPVVTIPQKPKKKNRVLPILAAAACLVLIVGAGRLLFAPKGSAAPMLASGNAYEEAAMEAPAEAAEAAPEPAPEEQMALPPQAYGVQNTQSSQADTERRGFDEEYELTGRYTAEELRTLLAGVPSRMDTARLDPFCLLLSDGYEFRVYSLDGAIYWVDPETGDLTLADTTQEEFGAILQP